MKKIMYGLISFFLPAALLFAQTGGNLSNTRGLVNNFWAIVNTSIGVLTSLALLVFIWGIVKYIYSQGTDAKADGKKIMIGGVVALFVLFSVWGIIRFIQEDLGVTQGSTMIVPRF